MRGRRFAERREELEPPKPRKLLRALGRSLLWLLVLLVLWIICILAAPRVPTPY